MKQNIIPILDNGHGSDTPGKRSPVWPDGSQLFEYEFNRDVVRRISLLLKADGIRHFILVPEQKDIPLPDRCGRANELYDKYESAVLFSIHANAGGGTGWEYYTSVGQTEADLIASELARQAELEFAPDGWKIRSDYSDGDPDKESQFYILKHTKCPAVLSENFFIDTKKDCRFLMTREGRDRCALIHYKTIKSLIDGTAKYNPYF